MKSCSLLLAEDDAEIAEVVQAYLGREGFQVDWQADGVQAWRSFQQATYQLVVLDIGLPLLDGLTLCRQIRAHSTVPMIILSARDDPMDKILGLELGADDYLVKPFVPQELVLRITSLLRRSQTVRSSETLKFRDLQLDLGKRRVTAGQRVVALTPSEMEVLEVFLRHPGQVLSREQILHNLDPSAVQPESRRVDTHLRNLRLKLPGLPIRAVRGLGYRLD